MKNKKLFAILTLVCFMFTLMPVAAFAAVSTEPVSESQSYAWTVDAGATIKAGVSEAAEVKVQIWDRYSEGTSTTKLYVWATKDGSNVPVESLNVYTSLDMEDIEHDGKVVGQKLADIADLTEEEAAAGEYIYELDGEWETGNSFYVGFVTVGTFKLHVSATCPSVESGKIASAKEFTMVGGKDTVTTYSDADDTKLFYITTDIAGAKVYTDAKTEATNGKVKDGYTVHALAVDANNVDEKEVKFTLYKGDGKAASFKTVEIEVAGAIDTDVDSVTTDMLGQASFKVSGNREGIYKIYLSTGKYESVIEVEVGAIGANTIKGEGETAPYDLIGDVDFGEVIEFTMYDVNGNKLDPETDKEGWVKANFAGNQKKYVDKDETGKDITLDVTGYVAIVEQPAASKLTNADLYFDGDTIVIKSGKKITAEGEYTFKVVLDNGAYATASCVVKAFDKPVQLVINAPANIELGAVVSVDTDWVDAAGVVEPDTKGVEVVATGYAVKYFTSGDEADEYVLSAKSDEKYVGSVITLTAVDERYNLIATEEVTIANEAKELAFTAKTAAVNVNNYIDVNVVDEDGKVVSLGQNLYDENGARVNNNFEISYVILDKPEGANVFVTTYEDEDLLSDGVFTMNLTSNKVGNVAVQAVLKYEYTTTQSEANDTNVNVVKYYTGSQIFAVGTEGVGDVVVMSIGSNEIVVNDAVKEIPAAPIVENNRTFVPFRALIEAFGAEVAWDEATQAVTAEMNGVTVVMTIGSATYTVNGVEKTMDVAPFINASSTMVPVRFVAEEFGIKVIPTYDENGATADILFNL